MATVLQAPPDVPEIDKIASEPNPKEQEGAFWLRRLSRGWCIQGRRSPGEFLGDFF